MSSSYMGGTTNKVSLTLITHRCCQQLSILHMLQIFVMDYISPYLPDKLGLFYYVFVGACVLGALYFNDLLNKVYIYGGGDNKLVHYGYQSDNVSAINVPSEIRPLQFSDEFSSQPYDIKIYNTGLNVTLYANWYGNRRPSLTGGPLDNDIYALLHIKFRWGRYDGEGSEHMIDTRHFACEMQLAFSKQPMAQQCDVINAARNRVLLMVSYLFMVTPDDNPYLEPLVSALDYLKLPSSCQPICPFPLKLLAPTFSKNYFYYEGSLTFPPCTEGVIWIVQSEPLAISHKQIEQFRSLLGCQCAPIATNCRPVQLPNDRDVFYYD
ncbi:carbonic anhydrase 1-like isoform X2 [Cylas formicarius]|uniref:carbonic anhydrase 1-like isoform X2 n=1 Tax=Cylas formicarius TaxID=197179 RepID=UPI0029586567|nr:carbonic anhydrase 1-like isoform X2 [Cylas formicarius]